MSWRRDNSRGRSRRDRWCSRWQNGRRRWEGWGGHGCRSRGVSWRRDNSRGRSRRDRWCSRWQDGKVRWSRDRGGHGCRQSSAGGGRYDSQLRFTCDRGYSRWQNGEPGRTRGRSLLTVGAGSSRQDEQGSDQHESHCPPAEEELHYLLLTRSKSRKRPAKLRSFTKRLSGKPLALKCITSLRMPVTHFSRLTKVF